MFLSGEPCKCLPSFLIRYYVAVQWLKQTNGGKFDIFEVIGLFEMHELHKKEFNFRKNLQERIIGSKGLGTLNI